MAEQIIALTMATAVLAAIPGPNVAFIVANSLQHGFRFGAVAVLGTTLGIAAQLTLVVLGLAAVLATAAELMLWIKWLGVAYLFYLGVRALLMVPERLDRTEPSGDAVAAAFWRGMGLALVNPKTLMFNAAFLPQFVPPGSAPAGLAPFALVYLGVLLCADLTWAAFASRAREFLKKFAAVRHKISGGFLIGAGAALALARIQK